MFAMHAMHLQIVLSQIGGQQHFVMQVLANHCSSHRLTGDGRCCLPSWLLLQGKGRVAGRLPPPCPLHPWLCCEMKSRYVGFWKQRMTVVWACLQIFYVAASCPRGSSARRRPSTACSSESRGHKQERLCVLLCSSTVVCQLEEAAICG